MNAKDPLQIAIQELKNNVITGKTLEFNWRIEQLNRIDNLLSNNQNDIINSLYKDLGKSKIESLSEILLIKEEIILVKKKLKSWMRPNTYKTPIYLYPTFSKVTFEPLGCVLILGPYNYPLLYILKPLVNIFSAGNTALIKPSEKCPNTSRLIKKLINKYFPNDTLIVIEGDRKIAKKLVNQKFDHIFFTGSTETGKSIMKSASKNLIPLTLELSGANPVIIFKNANLKVAAKRIVWGKFFNSGQSCMAPNHIFIEESIEENLIKEIKKTIHSFYGKKVIQSETLSKLEKQQFLQASQLLKKLKRDKRIIFGGLTSKKNFKISPTIVKVDNENDFILRQELFSPILPIMSFRKYQTALEIIQKSSKPLAIYIFGGNKKIHKYISDSTSSGTICINDVLLPVLIPNLPFGGVGLSGMGKFHGEEGFRNFSNQKSITYKTNFLDLWLRYPPYKNILKLIQVIFKI